MRSSTSTSRTSDIIYIYMYMYMCIYICIYIYIYIRSHHKRANSAWRADTSKIWPRRGWQESRHELGEMF